MKKHNVSEKEFTICIARYKQVMYTKIVFKIILGFKFNPLTNMEIM